jgi:hypothetical protein
LKCHINEFNLQVIKDITNSAKKYAEGAQKVINEVKTNDAESEVAARVADHKKVLDVHSDEKKHESQNDKKED